MTMLNPNKFFLHFLLANFVIFTVCHDNFGANDWAMPSNDQIDGTEQQSPFVQQSENINQPSWNVFYSPSRENANGNAGHQMRPYRRYIFGNSAPNFAKPPNPHSPWIMEQLRKGKHRELESFDGGIPPRPAEIPQALRNYFSLDTQPEKVVKELTGVDLRSIIGPALDQLLIGETTTAAPSWTRPTTPKDKLVEYFEKSLDNFLAGRFRPMERIPYLLENEGLMLAEKNGTKAEKNDNLPSFNGTEAFNNDPFEGSGEEPLAADEPPQSHSSISGIPKQMPFIPKMPADFLARHQDLAESAAEVLANENSDKIDKSQNKHKMETVEIRRHPGNIVDPVKRAEFGEKAGGYEQIQIPSKTMMDHFEYGTKPTYQQGVLGNVLDFFGISSPGGTVELDQVLTDWLMEHSPKHQSKMERRMHSESSFNLMKQLLSEPVMPLCTQQPEVIRHFNFDAFMGQWFEVMFSPLISSPSCTALSYRPLSQTGQPNGVGSIFQTVQFSVPKRNESNQFGMPNLGQSPLLLPAEPQLSSGYGIVSRPGQMIFRKSNSPEEIIVHVIDAGFSKAAGQYEWAILGINCNYPIYVIARDPYAFKQKYERLVILTLERKGLISEVSRMLNLVSAVNPAQCQMPKSLLGA